MCLGWKSLYPFLSSQQLFSIIIIYLPSNSTNRNSQITSNPSFLELNQNQIYFYKSGPESGLQHGLQKAFDCFVLPVSPAAALHTDLSSNVSLSGRSKATALRSVNPYSPVV